MLYPGRSSTSAGTDFRGAVLEEEGVGLVIGDVEPHLDERDWRSRGHGTDPRYNGVVLHGVVEVQAGNTTLQNGNVVPVVSLADMLGDAPASGPSPYLWGLLSACGYDQPETPDEMAGILESAGDAWFGGCSAGFRLFLDAEEDPEQVFYSAVLEALGYSQNRQPFLDLAHLAPYRRLEKAVVGAPREERAFAVAETLLKAAGFSPESSAGQVDGIHPRPGPQLRWNTFRVRPQNHPRNRIMAVSQLLDRYLPVDSATHLDLGPAEGGHRGHGVGKGLLKGFSEIMECGGEGASDESCRHLLDALMVRPSGKVDASARGSIGRGRAGDIAVNVVLPFHHALAEYRGDDGSAIRCIQMFRRFPKLQPNEVTREMEEQLCRHLTAPAVDIMHGGPQGKRRSFAGCAREQQGFLHLHHLITSQSVENCR